MSEPLRCPWCEAEISPEDAPGHMEQHGLHVRMRPASILDQDDLDSFWELTKHLRARRRAEGNGAS